ncbi:inositol-3-phosphate synthase [Streptomyces silvisoli]|uniref:Inositol-3-phosphate synthase n=1 Tax=Streptomyces silvisoli TaxID=3034235 RepID=A0ABT5ZKE2_9ACTN|nr:inositol-3-phosphate synthase [Streptomyces silvisoli]MDF3290295.1 inositol-3-phosphate synthase [Streptomyces silvisoli]
MNNHGATGAQVRVALAGVGSVSSSLVQAVELASERAGALPGIMHAEIGGYRLSDLEFVAAFDVDSNKVGADLSKAISISPTVAVAHVDVAPMALAVQCGLLLDGLDGHLSGLIQPHPDCAGVTIEQVSAQLVEVAADVLVCLLPAGSTAAVQAYAGAAALAGVGFVNATPEPVANDPELVRLFEENGAALLGDDLRSHLGATTLHTALIELLRTRSLTITNTYQINIGGNTDFLNLSDARRAAGKVRTKRSALQAAGIDASHVSAGPNGYVEYLGDTKTCFLRLEATSVLGSPLVMDVRLQVEDSPNAAGVLANAVRVAKVARDLSMAGVVDAVCPFLFKNPRTGATESTGLRMFTDFVRTAAARD